MSFMESKNFLIFILAYCLY